MEIYIHYGIYKTGSSFLQTNAARNRELLSNNDYYFPESIREQDMIAGRISPGNGNGIANYLKNGERSKMKRLLEQWVIMADKQKCSKILISDEALIHGFALASNLELLSDVLAEVGFKKVFCLGFFRNPVDHCLSTLKHRAKKGTIADFEDWILNRYETYDVLKKFLVNYKSVPFQWDFQLYQSDGNLMADYFFKKWLNIDNIPPYFNIKVNPSLTFSELSVLHAIREVDQRLVKYVYNGFLSLDRNQKANDVCLQQYYKVLAQKKLLQNQETVIALNKVFKESVFEIDIIEDVVIPQKPDLNLNEHQVSSLSQSLKAAYNTKSIVKDIILSVYRNFKQ